MKVGLFTCDRLLTISAIIVHPCATWNFSLVHTALSLHRSRVADLAYTYSTAPSNLEANNSAITVPKAPPPHRLVSFKPIPMADASSMLDTYILNLEAQPHSHPNALITPTDVTLASHGGPTGGIVMNNLRRIAAGLRGRYLEPEAAPSVASGSGYYGRSC